MIAPPGARSHTLRIDANELAKFQTLETAGKAENWVEIDKAAPCLPNTIQRVVEFRKSVNSNVRFGSLADIKRPPSQHPLSGVKRTYFSDGANVSL